MSTLDSASKSFPQAASRGAGGEQEDIRLFFTTAASIADIGLKLDESWSPAQRRTFVALAEDAFARLAMRTSMPAEEIVAWPLLDDLRIYPRSATEVLTAPVIELGHALKVLVSGTLPEPPIGKAWLYGTDEARQTLGDEVIQVSASKIVLAVLKRGFKKSGPPGANCAGQGTCPKTPPNVH